jgi:hypothetical protein
MKGKMLIVLILAAVVAGGVFGQEKSASATKHWISGEVGLLGAGLRYEYMLTENLSIGANVYWSSLFFFWNELEAGASLRYYPWGKNFFAGVGLGFHTHTGTFDYDTGYGTATWFGTITGAAITPEVGWKIDVGNAGGFFVQPGVKLPITLGKLAAYGASDAEFRVGFGVVPYCGLGWTF